MDVNEALKMIKDNGIAFVALQFTDAQGKLYALWVRPEELETGLKYGIGASGYPYFTGHEESDLLLKPDMSSFRVLPWLTNGRAMGSVMCDIYQANKSEELEEVPRFLLKRAIRKLKKEVGENVNLFTAPECEFHLIKRGDNGELRLHDQGSYFSPPPTDMAHELREEVCHALDQMGIRVIKQHHEAIRGKHEIDLEYDNALDISDKVQLAKLVLRKLANDRCLIATFMPKPFNVPGGAGWHTHVSLMDEKREKNLFHSSEGKYGLSDLALHFIAGVLRHAKALTALSNLSVNSYKRLIPGYQAPIYISWARNNRSTLIRIPASPPRGTRFEYRATDGLCNYYLFYAALICAGLDGIVKSESPPPPFEGNVYALTEGERLKRGIESLPGSLGEALEELKKDEVINSALKPLTPRFLRLEGEEWNEYSTRVHEWERQKYLEGHFTRYAEFRETGEKVLI